MTTGYSVFLTYSAVELILFATPSVSGDDENSKFRRKVMQAVGITSVFNLLVFVIVVGLLGRSGAAGKLWSTISVMQMIEIPGGFVHRQDAVMLSFWLLSIFTITSSLFHYLCRITKAVTGIGDGGGNGACGRLSAGSGSNFGRQGYILIFYAVVLFLLTMKPLNLDALLDYFGKYMAWVGFPQSIILPMILIIAGKIREGAKEHEDEK